MKINILVGLSRMAGTLIVGMAWKIADITDKSGSNSLLPLFLFLIVLSVVMLGATPSNKACSG